MHLKDRLGDIQANRCHLFHVHPPCLWWRS
jgi:hypothetical protein